MSKINTILGKIKKAKETRLELKSDSNKVELGIKEAIAELRSEVDFIRGEEQDLVKQASKAKSQILKIAASFMDSAQTSMQAAQGSANFVENELKGFGANDIISYVNKAYDSFETEYMGFVRAMQGVEDEAKQL